MHNKKKTLKLVSELIGYCYDVGMSEIHICIKLEADKDVISIQGEAANLSNEQLEEVKKQLNTPREMQVEEYYWELVGETGSAGELVLAGMLIDTADVKYENNILHIILSRKKK